MSQLNLSQNMQDNFNSIKVQLEPEYLYNKEVHIIRFQFHKGTIRTKNLFVVSSTNNAFQFHKGTIRTYRQVRLQSLLCYFNSIKVQLEPSYQ